MAIEILLADESRLVRDGLRCVLASCDGYTVVGETDDVGRAVALARMQQPHVAIVGADSPRFDGLRVIRQVRQRQCFTRFLVFSSHRTLAATAASLRAGASGYVHKSATPEEIRSGVVAVAAGDFHLEAPLADVVNRASRPGVARRILGSVLSRSQTPALNELLVEVRRAQSRARMEPRLRGSERDEFVLAPLHGMCDEAGWLDTGEFEGARGTGV